MSVLYVCLQDQFSGNLRMVGIETNFDLLILFGQPHHLVCKPAYFVPAASQDEVGGLRQEGHPM